MKDGILAPLVTPLLAQDTLDPESLERVIEHVIAGGVHGIFLLGTTGEGPALSARLRLETLERAAQAIRDRVPMLVNITGSSATENLQLAFAAARLGASAAVYAGPLWGPLAQDALAAHVERLSEQCPLPLFLYNMPSYTRHFFEVDTVARLAENSRVVGLKDSSGQLLYVQKLCRRLGPRFPVFIGPEEMLYPAMLAGAAGGVNGGSNLLPHLFLGIFHAVRHGNGPKAARLQRISIELSEAVYSSGYLRGLKAAMAVRGLCRPTLAEPEVELDEAAIESIAEALRRPEFQPPPAP